MIPRNHGETESEDDNVKRLENITRTIFDAINAREWEAAVWNDVAPSLVSHIRWSTNLYGFEETDKKAFIEVFRRFTMGVSLLLLWPVHEQISSAIVSAA